MITEESPLIDLLKLVEMVWSETERVRRGAPKQYSTKTMFKVYVVSIVKKLRARRSVWRYLSTHQQVAACCGLVRIPDRRTLDRRLKEIAPEVEQQIRSLGLVLSVEGVTDGSIAASDGSAFKTAGPVWHKKDKKAGLVPKGLHGLDTEADWIYSAYHGWVYGYKAHVTLSLSPATVRVVLDATITGSACESHVLQQRLAELSPLIETMLLDAGYDDADLLAALQQRGVEPLVPLSKPIGASTAQARIDRAAYLASPEGKARYRQRGSGIEPFFSTLKSLFGLDPLPTRGKTKASVFILLALYAWNLIVLFNFYNNRPLGEVKAILDIL
jgi:hypothetical protein